jgi:heme exporter protein D
MGKGIAWKGGTLMYFESFRELALMDGHGIFVWSVYIFATLVCVALIVGPLLKSRRIAVEVHGQIRREARIVN